MTENSINPAQSPAVVSAAAALIGDPARFGRVGEDGTVYVITPEGDKPVGSYPGKSNEEALAYFVRKFEAIASEVALLSARIKSGAMVPAQVTFTRVARAGAVCSNRGGIAPRRSRAIRKCVSAPCP